MTRLALALGLSALALFAGAAAPGQSASTAGRTVTVRDAALTPETLRVPVGAVVQFVNAGRKLHRIRAERNLWAPITLRPGARASVRLLAPGRYPYKVDGRRNGLLIAGTPIAGFAPPRGSTITTLTHRYSVRVNAHLHETSTFSNRRPGSTGTEDAELTWTTRIPVLVLRVQSVGDRASLGTRPAARGTFTGRFAFKDTRPDSTCFGAVDYTGLAAEVVLQGSREPVRSAMSFDAGLTVAAADAYEARRRAALEAAGCSSLDDADWLDETTPVDRGVRIHHPPSFSISAWDTRFSREGRGTFFPLDKMLAGQSFTVRSGPRGFEPRSCGDGCVEAFEGSVTYVFTALRPRR